MTEQQVAELKEHLEKTASRTCWDDDPDFIPNDYAGGNIDDSYYGGHSDGATDLARGLLVKFFGADLKQWGP